MEADFRILCPICGRGDIGSLPAHLQIHSKQALIDILVNKQENFGYQALKPASTDFLCLDTFGNEDGEMGGHSGRRSVSPPKKSQPRGASHSRRKSAAATGREVHHVNSGSQQASTSKNENHQTTTSLLYEMEMPDFGEHDLETTEIMPLPISSYSLPPTGSGGSRMRRDSKSSEPTLLHVLCPLRDTEEGSEELGIPKSDISHSNFIKYIIDEVIELSTFIVTFSCLSTFALDYLCILTVCSYD